LEQIVAEVIAGLVAAMVGIESWISGERRTKFHQMLTGLSSQLNGIIDESSAELTF